MTDELAMTILLNGPVARRGLDLVRNYYDSDDVKVQEITGDESDDERAQKFADADVLVTVDFNAKLPPVPKLKLIHLPAWGWISSTFHRSPRAAGSATRSSMTSASASM